MKLKKLSKSFYDRDTILVAKELLGKYLVRIHRGVRRVGRIVEVEAYLGPHDLAAHSARGRTARTEVMFGPPGHAYVYMIYGMYFCMNFVTEREGHAAAVLLRALEPIENIRKNTKGPGLLCNAVGIDKRLNGRDLESDDFHVAIPKTQETFKIIERPRIGVDYAGEWAKQPLRYYIEGNAFISKK
jgi:DNA-3-methyladenine glycosylase